LQVAERDAGAAAASAIIALCIFTSFWVQYGCRGELIELLKMTFLLLSMPLPLGTFLPF
jgi:hypothetical protein